MDQPSHRRRPFSSQVALRVMLVYLLIAGLWITFSDQVVAVLVPDAATITRVQTYKGWGFVIGMGILLYLEREQAERRTEENERLRIRAQSMFELAPNPILIVDLDTLQVLSANQNAVGAFGNQLDRLAQTLLGHPPVPTSPPARKAEPALPNAQATGKLPPLDDDPLRFTIPFVFEDGRELFLDVAVRGIPWRDQTAAIVMIADITERRRYEQSILELNEQLEQRVQARTNQLEGKNKELETFTFTVSHDLKAPLRGIDGYSQLLLEDHYDQLDEEGRHFLITIRQAAGRMNQLIDDLLAYSRLERRSLAISQVNPRQLVETTLREVQDELTNRSIAVTIDIPFQKLTVDSESLSQALRNLLDNALKFTHGVENPRIVIGGRETDQSCLLWVQDNGIGFDMKYHDRIFDIFQRLHKAEDYPGTGIGLAIVRKAAERIGGRVWAESRPGQGATFYLEIAKPL